EVDPPVARMQVFSGEYSRKQWHNDLALHQPRERLTAQSVSLAPPSKSSSSVTAPGASSPAGSRLGTRPAVGIDPARRLLLIRRSLRSPILEEGADVPGSCLHPPARVGDERHRWPPRCIPAVHALEI